MEDFRKQILEDMVDYRERYPNVARIGEDDWAFNFWVLDKLFSVEEEIIEEHIVDNVDLGVDCFVWHEEMRDLYLIQNKWFSDGTPLPKNYVQNDFLTRPSGALEKGTYTRSKELQEIFTKFSGEDGFSLHHYLYVSNNTAITPELREYAAKYNQEYASKHYDVRLFGLDEIQELYYNEPITDKRSFRYTIKTINKGTELSINNDAYRLTLALDAKYVLTPVVVIYGMYKEAIQHKYPLFDENIREYLGSMGSVNKKIVQTLKDPNDRANFFFYNNGITMIVSDIGKAKTQGTTRVFDVVDPQIVNGCQTVSTIYETLASLPESSLETDFASTFVMVKILKIPAENPGLKQLYKNIVTYNNSQNAINEKAFTANHNVFRNTQEEFEWKGFLISVKQSDKYQFTHNKYKTATKLIDRNSDLINKFGIVGKKKTSDFVIDLDKLLQIIIAFEKSPFEAVQYKAKLLQEQSTQNTLVVEFIKNTTTNELINLLLLYWRAEQEKNASSEGRIPNPFYFVYCISRYECGRDPSRIAEVVKTPDSINALVKKYTGVLKYYYKRWGENHPEDGYNEMIRSAVDVVLLDDCKSAAESFME